MKDIKRGHQGDVAFIYLGESIPPNIQKILNKNKKVEQDKELGLVIHHGEALGHYHRIKEPEEIQAYDLGIHDLNQLTLVEVNKDSPKNLLVHEEHGSQQLRKGYWVMATQREVVRGMVRPVLD